jgi:hypothetical protein
MAYGLAIMGLSFVPLTAEAWSTDTAFRLVPVLACATLLAIGTMMVFPFEMATIASLSGGRLIGTYYGLYNLLSGIGILAGNLLSGAAMDLARSTGVTSAPWLLLLVAGLLSAVGVRRLDRSGRLAAPEASPATVAR